MTAHPESSLTIREAYDRHYDKTEQSPGTQRLRGYSLKMWARLTGNPMLCRITNETAAEFKRKAVEAGYAPSTINTAWTGLRAILRRVGPPVTGNPFGLGIIDRIPAMKACKVERKLPRRLSLEALSRFYVGCRHARYPMRIGVPAPEWWRALLVVAFTTGLRRGDLFALTFDQIDFDSGELRTAAHKTSKLDAFPLHPVAIEHLQRIRTDRALIFAGIHHVGSRLGNLLRQIQDHAGVEHFTLKHLRSTANSEIDRIDRGLGPILLQHKPRDVNGRCYLNATDELREAIHKMRLPLAFIHGPKMTDRAQAQERSELERELMRPERFAIATKPPAAAFQFHGGSFWYRSQRYPMGGSRGRVLKALATANGPVAFDVLAQAITGRAPTPESYVTLQHKVSQVVSDVRKRLRKMMFLPAGWEPIPCVDLRGRGGAWTLCLPPASDRGREAS